VRRSGVGSLSATSASRMRAERQPCRVNSTQRGADPAGGVPRRLTYSTGDRRSPVWPRGRSRADQRSDGLEGPQDASDVETSRGAPGAHRQTAGREAALTLVTEQIGELTLESIIGGRPGAADAVKGGNAEPIAPNDRSTRTAGRSVQRAGTVPALPSSSRQINAVSASSVRHPRTSSSTPRAHQARHLPHPLRQRIHNMSSSAPTRPEPARPTGDSGRPMVPLETGRNDPVSARSALFVARIKA
jgi:hypothetical protein